MTSEHDVSSPSLATSAGRPWFVSLAAILFGAEALVFLACAGLTFLVSDTSSITVNDFRVVMGDARGYVFTGFFVVGALLVIACRGFLRGQSLSRFIALGMHAAVPLMLLIQEPEWIGWLQWISGCLLVGWYLFFKTNVRTFFGQVSPDKIEDA
ncbi:MAG: hypothetical protein AB8F65_07935 [Woeseiaceae bacterium]